MRRFGRGVVDEAEAWIRAPRSMVLPAIITLDLLWLLAMGLFSAQLTPMPEMKSEN